MFSEVRNFIGSLNIDEVSEERRTSLQPLIEYIKTHQNPETPIQLNFVCTHNSRRSQLSQVWAQVLSVKFNLNIQSYSGGVEVTACHPNTLAALRRSGLQFDKVTNGENPMYRLSFSDNHQPISLFSKLVEDAVNPDSDFAAIMTCDHAHETCPFIVGASSRVPILYKDPKAFDGTPKQQEAYDDTNRQIATELFYIFSKIN